MLQIVAHFRPARRKSVARSALRVFVPLCTYRRGKVPYDPTRPMHLHELMLNVGIDKGRATALREQK
jgi:hypothetical protein